jgi:hypothetical protein
MLVLLALTATNAIAGGEPRTHDGFFLRLSSGLGVAGTSIDDAAGDIEVDSQPSGDANFAIGGAIRPNLILHATMWGWILDEPDVTVGSVTNPLDGFIGMSAFGGGLTYYTMPANMYLSGSVGFGSLRVDGGPLEGDTDDGFVMDLTVGKEWWVGNAWGLGVAAAFSYHTIPDGDIDGNWSGTAFAVRFSATLN